MARSSAVIFQSQIYGGRTLGRDRGHKSQPRLPQLLVPQGPVSRKWNAQRRELKTHDTISTSSRRLPIAPLMSRCVVEITFGHLSLEC